MIQGYVHHLTLSCGCRILTVQQPDGWAGHVIRSDGPGLKRSLQPARVFTTPGRPLIGWSFGCCPISSCSQPGGPWTEVGPPVRVISDSVHAVHDTDRVPDGTYTGDLCCCSRTCPHGYWASVGKAQIKMEQLNMFE